MVWLWIILIAQVLRESKSFAPFDQSQSKCILCSWLKAWFRFGDYFPWTNWFVQAFPKSCSPAEARLRKGQALSLLLPASPWAALLQELNGTVLGCTSWWPLGVRHLIGLSGGDLCHFVLMTTPGAMVSYIILWLCFCCLSLPDLSRVFFLTFQWEILLYSNSFRDQFSFFVFSTLK